MLLLIGCITVASCAAVDQAVVDVAAPVVGKNVKPRVYEPEDGGYSDECTCFFRTNDVDFSHAPQLAQGAADEIAKRLEAAGFTVSRPTSLSVKGLKQTDGFPKPIAGGSKFEIRVNVETTSFMAARPVLKAIVKTTSWYSPYTGKHPHSGIPKNNWDAETTRRMILDFLHTLETEAR